MFIKPSIAIPRMLSFSNNERPQQQQQRSNLGNIQENEILRPSRRGRGHSRRSITWANISNIRNSFVLRPKPSGPSNTSSSSNNRNSRHWQHLRNFRNSIVTRTSRFRNNGGSDRGVGGARNNWRNFRDSFVIRVNRPETGDDDGDSGPGCDLCGICRCCTCFTFDFVKTPIGILKMVELIFCFVIQNILSDYGQEYTSKLGVGYTIMSLINSGCLIITLVLLLCYSFSSDTYSRVRPSLLEPVFSCVSAILYTLSSALLSRTVFIHLFHFYTKIPNFTAYPALTGAYVIGYALAAVLAIDGILAYRLMKSRK